MTSTGPQPTLEALRCLGAVLDSVDHDRSELDHESRLELVRMACTVARRVSALSAVLVAEADEAGSSQAAMGTPTSSWLLLEQSASNREAIGTLLGGKDLRTGDQIQRAALAGELPMDRARNVARAVRALPRRLTKEQLEAAEADLVANAARISERNVHRAVRETLARVAPEAVPSPEDDQARLEAQRDRAYARRHLRLVADGDGGVDVRGNLPVLEAAPLTALIESCMQSERRERRDAFDRGDFRDLRTPDQLRADALLALVQSCQVGGGAPNVAGDRPRVVVVLREEALRERAEQAGMLAPGEDVAAGDLRRLCCDADLTPVVLGGQSEPLDVGRSSRLVTPQMRQALSLRDGGCAFPGCAATDSRCEAHHLTPWWAGGETRMDNLVLLCPHHHALVEPARFFSEGRGDPDRWELRLDAHQRVEVIPPRRIDKDRNPIRTSRPAA